MVRGAEVFRRIQIGKENTRGSAVAADKRLFGTLTMTADKPRYSRETEERNSLAVAQLGSALSQRASMRYEGAATFEQIIHFLLMGVKGGVTPTQPSPSTVDGSPSVRLWTFQPTLSTRNAPNAYTVEYGDDIQAFRSKFGMVEELEITIPKDEEVRITANLFGHFPTTVSFTTGSSVAAVEEIVGTKGTIYIDSTWGARGGTQKSNLLINARLRTPTGYAPVRYHDGALDFSNFSETRRSLEVELTYISQADAVTEWKAYRDGTLRIIRLQVDGSTLGATSTEGALSKFLRLDMALQYTEPPEVFGGAEDGENVIRLTGRTFQTESSTGGERDFIWAVQNTVATAS
jgi:hypothetical protein